MVKIRPYPAEVSRRGLLHGVACAAAGVAVAGASGRAFAAKKKKSQADVAYQDTPHGNEKCSNSEPFIPQNQCLTVEGPVSANGWCNIFSAK